MMRTKLGLATRAAVCGLGLSAMATPTLAVPVYVTYTGAISGIDVLGDFGQPNSNIAGLAYTAIYAFDVDYSSSSNASNFGDGTSPPANDIIGGTLFFTDSPVIFASITVGSTTITVGGGIWGEIFAQNDGGSTGVTTQFHLAMGSGGFLKNEFFNFQGTSGLTASIETPFSFTFNPATDSGEGSFCEVALPNSSTADCLALSPNTLTVSLNSPSPAPEPSTVAMFFAGLLGLLALRRRLNADV